MPSTFKICRDLKLVLKEFIWTVDMDLGKQYITTRTRDSDSTLTVPLSDQSLIKVPLFNGG